MKWKHLIDFSDYDFARTCATSQKRVTVQQAGANMMQFLIIWWCQLPSWLSIYYAFMAWIVICWSLLAYIVKVNANYVFVVKIYWLLNYFPKHIHLYGYQIYDFFFTILTTYQPVSFVTLSTWWLVMLVTWYDVLSALDMLLRVTVVAF